MGAGPPPRPAAPAAEEPILDGPPVRESQEYVAVGRKMLLIAEALETETGRESLARAMVGLPPREQPTARGGFCGKGGRFRAEDRARVNTNKAGGAARGGQQ